MMRGRDHQEGTQRRAFDSDLIAFGQPAVIVRHFPGLIVVDQFL